MLQSGWWRVISTHLQPLSFFLLQNSRTYSSYLIIIQPPFAALLRFSLYYLWFTYFGHVYIREIMKYLFFSVWLISLQSRKTFTKILSVLLEMTGCHSFYRQIILHYLPVYLSSMYVCMMIYLSLIYIICYQFIDHLCIYHVLYMYTSIYLATYISMYHLSSIYIYLCIIYELHIHFLYLPIIYYLLMHLLCYYIFLYVCIYVSIIYCLPIIYLSSIYLSVYHQLIYYIYSSSFIISSSRHPSMDTSMVCVSLPLWTMLQ